MQWAKKIKNSGKDQFASENVCIIFHLYFNDASTSLFLCYKSGVICFQQFYWHFAAVVFIAMVFYIAVNRLRIWFLQQLIFFAPVKWFFLLVSFMHSHLCASGYGEQSICPQGSYCTDGKRFNCPEGRYGDRKQMTCHRCSGECLAGYFCPKG